MGNINPIDRSYTKYVEMLKKSKANYLSLKNQSELLWDEYALTELEKKEVKSKRRKEKEKLKW